MQSTFETENQGGGRGATADRLESVASTLHSHADDLPGGESMRDAARATADKMRKGAQYIRENDASAMWSGTRRIVGDYPGWSLLAAAAFGFTMARLLSRD